MRGEDCDGIYLLVLSAELEEKVKMNSDPVDDVQLVTRFGGCLTLQVLMNEAL